LLADGTFINMDEFVAASSERSAVVPSDVDDVDDVHDDLDHRARECARTQKMEGKQYIASDLAALLRQRKRKAGHAKYWEMLAVDIVTTEEKDGNTVTRSDKVVVRCLSCGDTHDSKHLNVPNFARTHFLEPQRGAICKKKNATGLLYFKIALLPKIH
jgi:hypothetical protein